MRDTQCASNQTDDYLPCPIERVASVHSCVVPTMLNRGKNVGLWTGSKDYNQTTTNKSEPAMPVLPGVEEMSSRLMLSLGFTVWLPVARFVQGPVLVRPSSQRGEKRSINQLRVSW